MADDNGFGFSAQNRADESPDTPDQSGDTGSDSDWWTPSPAESWEEVLTPPAHSKPPRRGVSLLLLTGGIVMVLAVAVAAIGIWLVRPQMAARRARETETALVATPQPSVVEGEFAFPSAVAQATAVEAATPRPEAASAAPDIEPMAVAAYDAQGNLVSVASLSGEPVTNTLTAVFPQALESEQEYVPLSSAAEVLGQITALEGATYHDSTGELILFGRAVAGEPPLSADDLLVALRAASSGEYPGVSIDPGPNRREMVVRYIGPTQDTHFGEVMFEADRLLKTLGFGKDNVTGGAVTSAVPDFQSELDLAAANTQFDDPVEGQGVWHRFWYVVDRMRVSLSQDRHSMSILQSDLRVNTEYLGHDFKPVPGHAPDPEAQAFADHFTAHFSEFAAESPVVRQLVELAKLVCVAQWIVQEEIPLDPTWLSQQSPAMVDTAETTPAITVTRELSRVTTTETRVFTERRIVSLYGGVNLSFSNEYVMQEPTLGAEAMGGRPSEAPPAWSYTSSADGAVRRAVALPVVPVERLTAKVSQPVDDLNLGALGDIGLPLTRQYRAPDSRPSELGYGWSFSLSRLEFPEEAAEFTLDDSTQISLYPEITLLEAKSQKRRRYIAKGVRPDGTILYENEADGGQLALLLDGTYTVTRGSVEWTFGASGLLLESMDADGHRAEYQFTDGHLTRIETSSGARISLSYEGGRVSQVTLDGGRALRYRYDGSGDLVEVVDGQGNPLWRYGYDSAHQLTYEQDLVRGLERQYAYDASGHIVAWGDNTGEYEVQEATLGTFLLSLFRGHVDEPIQASIAVRPEALTSVGMRAFRKAFGSRFDSDLTGYELMRQDPSLPADATVVYAARPGARQVALLVGERYVAISVGDASDAEILRGKLWASGALQGTGPIFVVGPSQGVIDLQAALPDRIVLHSQGLDAKLTLQNYQRVLADRPLSPETTEIHVALPTTKEQLVEMGFDEGAWDRQGWAAIAPAWVRAVQNAGFRVSTEGVDMAGAIRHSLATSPSTLIVIAHSDGKGILMPDGTVLDLDRFDEETRELVMRNHPFVFVVGCDVASMTDTLSLAKRMVDMGARGVAASEKPVNAVTALALLDSLLRNPDGYATLLEAWRRAIQDAREIDPQLGSFKFIIGELPGRANQG